MTWGQWGRHHYHDKHVGGHLQFFMCVWACMYVHVCACVHVWRHPPDSQTPHHPPAPLQELQGAQKKQNSISPELIEIIRFCLRFFTSKHS